MCAILDLELSYMIALRTIHANLGFKSSRLIVILYKVCGVHLKTMLQNSKRDINTLQRFYHLFTYKKYNSAIIAVKILV